MWTLQAQWVDLLTDQGESTEGRVEVTRVGDTVRTTDRLMGEPTLHGLVAKFYSLKTKKMPAGSVALSD